MASPMDGVSDVVIEGVVVGDWQNSDLAGFFVQEQDADADDTMTTSEGIFVYDVDSEVSVGNVVRLRGDVTEYKGLTEIHRVQEMMVCGAGAQVTPAPITLPLPDASYLERFEGMQVILPQDLTVSENYDLGRYGQVVLSLDRLAQPTDRAAPGAAAKDMQAANDLNRILLDDGSTWQNPDPIVYPAPGLNGTHTLRDGDTVAGLVGVLTYSWSGYKDTEAYRIHATDIPVWNHRNPRPTTLPIVGGTIRIAGMNVLNYFNGDGAGGGFPTSRGADSLSEFKSQQTKLVSALLGLDADVLALIEIENDGYGPTSAIVDLVNALNARAPDGTGYTWIDPGFSPGTDEIAVGLIYRPDIVRPQGQAATTAAFPFDRNRPPLAQTFEDRATGARFTVVVAHFKSKSCSGATGDDADQGDGQSCYNGTRTRMASALTGWLATDPTGSRDPDFLLLGDLNAYARETPIVTLQDAGYVDLVPREGGLDAYSYVYYGQAGRLDYAFASGSLAGQITGGAYWHINADEPHVLDYNEEFKSITQLHSLYDTGPYRSADHDPVLIGLDLEPDRRGPSADQVLGCGLLALLASLILAVGQWWWRHKIRLKQAR